MRNTMGSASSGNMRWLLKVPKYQCVEEQEEKGGNFICQSSWDKPQKGKNWTQLISLWMTIFFPIICFNCICFMVAFFNIYEIFFFFFLRKPPMLSQNKINSFCRVLNTSGNHCTCFDYGTINAWVLRTKQKLYLFWTPHLRKYYQCFCYNLLLTIGNNEQLFLIAGNVHERQKPATLSVNSFWIIYQQWLFSLLINFCILVISSWPV